MPYLDPTGQVLVSSEPARLSGPGTAEDCHCGTSGIGEDPRVYWTSDSVNVGKYIGKFSEPQKFKEWISGPQNWMGQRENASSASDVVNHFRYLCEISAPRNYQEPDVAEPP